VGVGSHWDAKRSGQTKIGQLQLIVLPVDEQVLGFKVPVKDPAGLAAPPPPAGGHTHWELLPLPQHNNTHQDIVQLTTEACDHLCNEALHTSIALDARKSAAAASLAGEQSVP
jgi:hypothetical protein